MYSHAQLRIYFPDGTRIEGKFLPNEKIATVKNVIASTFVPSASSSSSSLEAAYASCLHPFDLYISPPRRILAEDKSLKQEGLVPAAKIHVSWKNSTTASASSISMSTLIQSRFFPASTNSNNVSSFPESKSVVDNNKKRGNIGNTASASAASKGNESSSEADKAAREEELMQKMLGKRKGLGFGLGGKLGKNKSKGSDNGSGSNSGSGAGSSGGDKKPSSRSGKPKWFK